MSISRREFLSTSSKFGVLCVLPPALLNSCSIIDRKSDIHLDYIGPVGSFEFYQQYFNKIRGIRFAAGTLDSSLKNEAGIVFLDSDLATRSAYMIMLMEQGKDILTSFPMGNNLGEYANISEFMVNYGRTVGLLNPLPFYPSMKTLKGIIDQENIALEKVTINTHPSNLGGDVKILGIGGTAQPFQRVITYLTDTYPMSLVAGVDETGRIASIIIDFESFEALIQFDDQNLGWDMELSAHDFTALTDHTGMLALRNKVEPRIPADPDVMENAIITNIQDFLQAVEERSEPRVSHLDGLASIMVNKAVEESIITSAPVNL